MGRNAGRRAWRYAAMIMIIIAMKSPGAQADCDCENEQANARIACQYKEQSDHFKCDKEAEEAMVAEARQKCEKRCRAETGRWWGQSCDSANGVVCSGNLACRDGYCSCPKSGDKGSQPSGKGGSICEGEGVPASCAAGEPTNTNGECRVGSPCAGPFVEDYSGCTPGTPHCKRPCE